MARKSRKASVPATGAAAPASSERVWRAAGYARLSVPETRDRGDGEALQNQKALLREFIGGRPELRLRRLFEDDGRTGTDFSRPGFQALLRAIRGGEIDCVVVKDLSRFGRDYIEAGDYLEHVFPRLGVRFISVGDGYDSADPLGADCLAAALRNLVNQMYSMDISRKTGSILREKQRRGEFIGSYAAYGYLKDPEDRHRLVADPEAAEVVREIFRRRADGEGNAAIARRLNGAGVPSPGTYRYQKGIVKDGRFAGGKPWRAETVRQILGNPVYLGHTVQGRRVSEFYAGRPERRLPPEEWAVTPGTHEPLVTREAFDRAQAGLPGRKAR